MESLLARCWAATLKDAPGATAVIDAATGKRWSRYALERAAARIAKSYQSCVPRPWHRRVIISVPNGGEWFSVFLGLVSAGAIPVPIDPAEPLDSLLAASAALGVTHYWRDGQFSQVLRSRRTPGRVRSECLVKLTSGSSGIPKGLPATGKQMMADGRQICATMGIRPSDSNLAAIPLGYSYGLGNLVMPLVLQGTRVICASSSLPHALAADAARYKPTVFPAVPPVLKALAASDLAAGSLDSLRLVISAGSPLQPEVAQAFHAKFGTRVHGFYGTSETGGIAYDRSGEATMAARSVGTPMEGVRIDSGRGGTFSVSSAAVLGKGRFAPADRALTNEWGELVLLGRTDRAVKIAGRRVDLAEIERAMRSLPGIRDAYVHALEGADSVLSAAAVSDLSPAEIRRMLRLRLAPWKVPGRILALPDFPVTGRGKTDFNALRQVLSTPRTATSSSTLSAARQISART